MKTKIIKEPIMSSLLFVWDCTEKDFSNYMLKKFNSEVAISGAWGKMITINKIYWIIWANKEVNLAHELIHFVREVFSYYKMTLCEENEEVFCRMHSFYFEECLKLLNKK